MHLTWDRAADAAYLSLTTAELPPGRDTVECPVPAGAGTTVLLDWRDGRLVGVEVLAASTALPPDLLARAEVIDR